MKKCCSKSNLIILFQNKKHLPTGNQVCCFVGEAKNIRHQDYSFISFEKFRLFDTIN